MSLANLVLDHLKGSGLADEAARLIPQPGGQTNFVWQLTGSVPRMIKLYRPKADTPLFPNDADAEWLVLNILAGLNLAPEPIQRLHIAQMPGVLTTYLSGETWRADTVHIGRLLRRVHDTSVADAPLRTTPSDIVAHGMAILNLCVDRTLAGLKPDNIELSAPQVLLHGDPVPGNIIVGPKGCHLIDWQCPARGPAHEDIALFLSPAMQMLYRGAVLTDDEVLEFFVGYGCDPGYQYVRAQHHWRMACYCQWRIEQGAIGYAAGLSAECSALTQLQE